MFFTAVLFTPSLVFFFNTSGLSHPAFFPPSFVALKVRLPGHSTHLGTRVTWVYGSQRVRRRVVTASETELEV